MVIYSCRFCSQSSEDCPSFYSRRKGTWRVSVFNSAVLTPHLLNGFLFTLHLIGGIFSFTMFMGWWIQINIFSTPLFSISKMMMASNPKRTPDGTCTHTQCYGSLYAMVFAAPGCDKLNFIFRDRVLFLLLALPSIMTWSYCVILMKYIFFPNAYVLVTKKNEWWWDGVTIKSRHVTHCFIYCNSIVIKCSVNGASRI